MKKWLDGLSVREQRLLKSGTLIVSLGLFVAFVFLPANRSLDDKAQRLGVLKQQLNQMEQSRPNGSAAQQLLPITSSFSVWLDQQMVQLNLQNLISRAEPVDESTMTLWLQNAPFDPVIDWLMEVEQRFGVTTTNLDVVQKDKASGLSDIRMTLVR